MQEPAPTLGRGRIDLFWPGVLLGESKSRHKDLNDAYRQALEYIGGLPDHEKPQYVFVSDFARLRLYDLCGSTVYPAPAEHTEIQVADLGRHVRLFGFMAGYQQRTYQEQDPVNRAAAERMGRLHDQLAASGYHGTDLERYLVRLLFCLFAEDTDIFPRTSFMDLVSQHAGPKGQLLGQLILPLFPRFYPLARPLDIPILPYESYQ
ncbi:MAG: type IIL restriction-modification enzyme MmeI [Hymenobacter sp.]